MLQQELNANPPKEYWTLLHIDVEGCGQAHGSYSNYPVGGVLWDWGLESEFQFLNIHISKPYTAHALWIL